ncbi:TSUP family transporter [Treponema sp. OMZ 838]|uniref:sulfite exporter TauE/SafE family protein n=1 Tax=unclassified Treponema TaxID=2638727 RepID=UPI0005300D2F|nr:membrane protein [Treponema sp. OMZ 838]UTC51907.1 TSUP family transporter [Treponema sp. OMZ 855]
MHISIWALAFLWFFVFLGGFVDSAAGGGGLISLPAYLFVGLPPHTAIGCNKFSAACGTTLSAARFFKNGAVDWQVAAVSAVCSSLSSYIGIRIALMINQETLKTVLVIVLPIVAVLLLFKRNFGTENQSAEIPKKKAFVLAACTGLLIGFYDGLIGPGTGTIAIIVFSAWMKYDLKTASGNAKVMNLASNYATLIAVITGNKVVYSIAIPAAVFGIIGNYIGAGFAIKKGTAFIKPLMICVIILLFGKLFYDVFGTFLFS